MYFCFYKKQNRYIYIYLFGREQGLFLFYEPFKASVMAILGLMDLKPSVGIELAGI